MNNTITVNYHKKYNAIQITICNYNIREELAALFTIEQAGQLLNALSDEIGNYLDDPRNLQEM